MPFLNEIVLIVNLAIYGAIIYAIVRLCRKKIQYRGAFVQDT